MSKNVSIPDYYITQSRLAEKYGIPDHHAGCYIYHYPESKICSKCPYAPTCEKIFEEDGKTAERLL